MSSVIWETAPSRIHLFICNSISFYLHQASPQHQDRAGHQGHTGSDQDQDQDPTAAANQEAAEESGGSVPALVITQAEEVSAETEKPDGK